jgi:hypothetical protein
MEYEMAKVTKDNPYYSPYGSTYMLKHRLVMAEYLGRKLDKNEVVHHKNGDKKDNRLENLELVNQQSIHAINHYRELKGLPLISIL